MENVYLKKEKDFNYPHFHNFCISSSRPYCSSWYVILLKSQATDCRTKPKLTTYTIGLRIILWCEFDEDEDEDDDGNGREHGRGWYYRFWFYWISVVANGYWFIIVALGVCWIGSFIYRFFSVRYQFAGIVQVGTLSGYVLIMLWSPFQPHNEPHWLPMPSQITSPRSSRHCISFFRIT